MKCSLPTARALGAAESSPVGSVRARERRAGTGGERQRRGSRQSDGHEAGRGLGAGLGGTGQDGARESAVGEGRGGEGSRNCTLMRM